MRLAILQSEAMITEKEAYCYWHRAVGTPYPAIAKKLKITEAYAKSLFYSAVAKSRRQGISYLRHPKKETQQPAEPAVQKPKQPVELKQDKLKGFAALKALADEIFGDAGKK